MSTYPPRKGPVLIIASEDMIVRNILDTGVWDSLAPLAREYRFTVIVPNGKSRELIKRFALEPDQVREFMPSRPSRIESFIGALLYAGLSTHTNHWSKMRAYLRGDAGFVSTYLKRLHSATLGRIHAYQRLLRYLYEKVGKDASARAVFDEVDPVLVIAFSITNFSVDMPLLREAKRRRIRTVGMTRSWDNLTSHGAVRVVPDRIIVQNQFLADAARGVQGIRPADAHIDIVGLPHYDFYSDLSLLESREQFFERNGLDLSKKVITYCGMGDFLFKREGDILDILEEDIEGNAIHVPGQVLYSAHPKFRSSLEQVKGKKHVHLSPEIRYIASDSTERNQGVRDLINFIHHSDVLVMGASTMAIDAAMLDRPVVCVGFDGYAPGREISFWDSVRRFYDSYTHFEALVKTGGVRVAHDRLELISLIERYLTDPTLDRENRKEIVDLFTGLKGGMATARLTKVLLSEIHSS